MSVPSLAQNPLGGSGVDFYQNPPVIIANRAPLASDPGLLSQFWVNQAVTPNVVYQYTSANTWTNYSASINLSSPPPIGDVTPNTGAFDVLTVNFWQVTGGAVTSDIGTVTLVNGTATVANTNITAEDYIWTSREGINASSAIGFLNVSKVADTSFTITSLQADGTTETNDVSTVRYVIIREA